MELALETELSRKPVLQASDATALTREQQEALNLHKVDTRIQNEQYLRQHPEVAVMISSFVSQVLLKRPGKIREFAAEYFTDSTLPDEMKKKLEATKNSHNQRTQ